MDTSALTLGPDISILQPNKQKSETLPSEAAVILSSLGYDESNSKLLIRGRISKLNADRLNRVSNQKGSNMKIKFNVFQLNNKQWSSKLGSNNGDINGIITDINMIEQNDQDQTYQELVIELTPTESLEYIETNNNQQIVWGGPSAQRIRCKTNKRDRIHEIIDSAVLL